ncbi:hypothetical protein ACRAWG_23755 [Methylobacterium sp. P31]
MHAHTVSVRVKNGSWDPSDDLGLILPAAFIRCEQLWKGRGDRRSWPKDQWAFARDAIEPLLYATIDPEDVHYDNGLLNPRGTIYSRSVELSSVSFENGPIPIISAYARFELTFDREFKDTAAFYDWQEQTDWLDWGTNFGWRFEDGSEYDAAYDNAGIELEIMA